jgi:hypothetical protein
MVNDLHIATVNVLINQTTLTQQNTLKSVLSGHPGDQKLVAE